MGSLEDRDLGIMSRDQFLDQLPSAVVQKGEMVPIREPIAERMGAVPKPSAAARPTGTGDITVETTVDTSPDPNRKFTTLRIKTETGYRTLLIKMWYDTPFAELKPIIDMYKEGTEDVEVRSTFPPRLFELSSE
jgi:hypothetical protein